MSGTKAAQEACEDLVLLSVLFTERCITEHCNMLSNVQGTQGFSTRATVVLQLLILCFQARNSLVVLLRNKENRVRCDSSSCFPLALLLSCQKGTGL